MQDLREDLLGIYRTIFYGKNTPVNEILETLALIARGSEVSDLSLKKGVGENTIVNWLQEAAQHPRQVDEALMKEFKVDPVQLDALWKTLRGKGGNNGLE